MAELTVELNRRREPGHCGVGALGVISKLDPPSRNHVCHGFYGDKPSDSAWPPQMCAAIERPAIRPEKRQPPRNVPSSALYPCIPPPPKPAASPAAHSPGKSWPSVPYTRASRSVSRPPSVLRVRM